MEETKVKTKTLGSIFKDIPTIPEVGIPPYKLSTRERTHRLLRDIWTNSDGSSQHISEMTTTHIFNVMKYLQPLQKKNSIQKIWVTTFTEELKKRNTPESKQQLAKLALIK